jgi:Fic family protein
MSARTHPYIEFDFDVKLIDSYTWMLLGEAMSKCQHLAGSPLKPPMAKEMASVYLARGLQATTAIEGNTLSTDEVREIVETGRADLPESRDYQQLEVRNVLDAIREIDSALQEGSALPIDRDRLCYLNKLVLEGIPDKPEVVPGHLREHNVTAGPYRAPDWSEVPELVDQLVMWLEKLRSATSADSRPEDRFVNAMLSAILAHLYIAWVHPFGNGNGRLARLIEVQILSESGIVPLVATNLLSDHYNKTRPEYYLALDAAQRNVADFVRYAVRGFIGEIRDQVSEVRNESLEIHWESYVYERFKTMPSTTARDRQRQLALDMPADRAVTKEEATELTIGLAKLYAVCGERTPARDLNDLAKMGLVRKLPTRRYRAERGIIRAFLPPVANLSD